MKIERSINRSRDREPDALERVHRTGDEASGGHKLGVMRYVLGGSLAAIVIIFAGLLLSYF